MGRHPPDRDGLERTAARFQTTRWSRVDAARDGGASALGAVCEIYWYPLYAFLRRRGWGPEAAEDLVQGFFARLLEKGDLAGVSRDKGRFRSFLMAACAHYAANRADHDRALKRGGGRTVVSIDRAAAEGRYGREPAHGLTAERLFERRWALTLLDRVLARMEAEAAASGRSRLFAELRPALLGSGDRAPHAEVAAALGMTEEAVRAAAKRLRQRYRVVVREEVAQTVGDPADVEDEIRALFTALGP